jgi:hypothetical protein
MDTAKALAGRISPKDLNGGIVRWEFLIGRRQTAANLHRSFAATSYHEKNRA